MIDSSTGISYEKAFIFSYILSPLQGAGDRKMKNQRKQGLQGIYK